MIFVLLLLMTTLHARELPTNTTTQVSADNASFDGKKITLSGEVTVSSSAYTLSAAQAILVKDEEKRSTLEFPWVELKEKVRASFYQKYFLECETVHLDYLAHTLDFTSDTQVFFYDATRKLFADTAHVDYTEEHGDFEVTKITLTGHVHLESDTQVAFADILELFPQEERLFLKATENRRVLFSDKGKELQISAECVKAEKRPGIKGEFIEGIGDVRFIFKEEEFQKLKEKFEWKS